MGHRVSDLARGYLQRNPSAGDAAFRVAGSQADGARSAMRRRRRAPTSPATASSPLFLIRTEIRQRSPTISRAGRSASIDSPRRVSSGTDPRAPGPRRASARRPPVGNAPPARAAARPTTPAPARHAARRPIRFGRRTTTARVRPKAAAFPEIVNAPAATCVCCASQPERSNASMPSSATGKSSRPSPAIHCAPSGRSLSTSRTTNTASVTASPARKTRKLNRKHVARTQVRSMLIRQIQFGQSPRDFLQHDRAERRQPVRRRPEEHQPRRHLHARGHG